LKAKQKGSSFHRLLCNLLKYQAKGEGRKGREVELAQVAAREADGFF